MTIYISLLFKQVQIFKPWLDSRSMTRVWSARILGEELNHGDGFGTAPEYWIFQDTLKLEILLTPQTLCEPHRL